MVAKKRKVHETDDKSEDNSDSRVVVASLIEKKKSGPTSVKQHYVQERLPRHISNVNMVLNIHRNHKAD